MFETCGMDKTFERKIISVQDYHQRLRCSCLRLTQGHIYHEAMVMPMQEQIK